MLLSEKIYLEDIVTHDQTRNPLTGKMEQCIYKEGVAFNGHLFEYNEEYIFKDGVLIQENEYVKKGEKLSLAKSTFYNSKKENQKTKVTIFEEGKPYTLFYKNNRKHHGIEKNEWAKTTYINGEKTGPFEYYKDGKVVVSGQLKDGLKDGEIIFFSHTDNKNYICDYKEGSPINGTSVDDSWGSYSITNFKNGKRHGQRSVKHHSYTRKEHFKNGIQVGAVSWHFPDGRIIRGIIKNNTYFDGDFYDPEFNIAESYIQEKKQGLHKSNFGAMVVLAEKFNNGIKTWEQATYAIGDTVFSEGIYKNNLPYSGTFISQTEYDLHYITPYKNGKKHGKQTLNSIYGDLTNYGYTQYVNGKKKGDYLLIAPDFLPKGVKQIHGIYKDDRLYSGAFILDKTTKAISTFKNGIKIN